MTVDGAPGAPGRLEWCITPLDLALAVETLARVSALADPSEADRIDGRLSRHVDRVLDGARLQLSSEHPHALVGGGDEVAKLGRGEELQGLTGSLASAAVALARHLDRQERPGGRRRSRWCSGAC